MCGQRARRERERARGRHFSPPVTARVRRWQRHTRAPIAAIAQAPAHTLQLKLAPPTCRDRRDSFAAGRRAGRGRAARPRARRRHGRGRD
eukprot:35583-Prymnesium_polylepis.1